MSKDNLEDSSHQRHHDHAEGLRPKIIIPASEEPLIYAIGNFGAWIGYLAALILAIPAFIAYAVFLVVKASELVGTYFVGVPLGLVLYGLTYWLLDKWAELTVFPYRDTQ